MPSGPTKFETHPPRHHLDLDRLLNLAAVEFARHGIDGVSMGTLAEKCSVTKAALYYHFESKEALYEEVCNRKLEEIAQVVAANVAEVREAYDKLEVFVGTLFDLWTADKTMLLISLRDSMRPWIDSEPSGTGRHFQYFMSMIARILDADYDSGKFPDIAFPLASLLYGYCSLMGHDGLTREKEGSAYRAFRKTELLGLVRDLWEKFEQHKA